MFNRLLILNPILAALAIGGCDGRGRGGESDGPTGEPRARDMDRRMMRGMMDRMMANMPDGVPASTLPEPESRGARFVARYGSQCHGIPSPARQSAEDWEPTLRRMVGRMDHMARMPMHGIEAPSEEEEEAILAYLQEHALRAAEPDELPDGGPGARLFADTCSRCHALPDPAQHAPGEWPGVVARMRANMRAMRVEEITDEQAAAIVDYLERVTAAHRAGATPRPRLERALAPHPRDGARSPSRHGSLPSSERVIHTGRSISGPPLSTTMELNPA